MRLYEAIVDISLQVLVENVLLPEGVFCNMSMGDVTAVTKACLEHPDVHKEIDRLGLSMDGVVCEPWLL